jgi:hypothetical protein
MEPEAKNERRGASERLARPSPQARSERAKEEGPGPRRVPGRCDWATLSSRHPRLGAGLRVEVGRDRVLVGGRHGRGVDPDEVTTSGCRAELFQVLWRNWYAPRYVPPRARPGIHRPSRSRGHGCRRGAAGTAATVAAAAGLVPRRRRLLRRPLLRLRTLLRRPLALRRPQLRRWSLRTRWVSATSKSALIAVLHGVARREERPRTPSSRLEAATGRSACGWSSFESIECSVSGSRERRSRPRRRHRAVLQGATAVCGSWVSFPVLGARAEEVGFGGERRGAGCPAGLHGCNSSPRTVGGRGQALPSGAGEITGYRPVSSRRRCRHPLVTERAPNPAASQVPQHLYALALPFGAWTRPTLS